MGRGRLRPIRNPNIELCFYVPVSVCRSATVAGEFLEQITGSRSHTIYGDCGDRCPPPRWTLTNWVVGRFEFGTFRDIYISRTVRPGCGEDSTCPCSFQYNTTTLEDLFVSCGPTASTHAVFSSWPISHWLIAKTTMKSKQGPGWLRAHQIVNVRRYAKPQLWGANVGQSSCPLSRDAQRCDEQ